MKIQLLLGLIGLAALASAQVKTELVNYRQGDTELEGYVAYQDLPTRALRPGVIIVHDWNSIDEYEQSRARQLAEMGYVAFAVDIYGKGIRPKNTQESGAQAGKFRSDRALLRARLIAGLEELKRNPLVDKSKIAAIGYCFGGTGVLELARSGADIAGVVSFHGGLDAASPADARNIKAKVLVCHGADDPNVPPTQVQAFMDEMKSGKVDYVFIAYSGAVHSFTNPGAGNNVASGNAYNADADRRSWQHMKDFFKEIFGA